MSVYRVESGGRAPAGLSAGDEVVTGGGTYRITGVNADGSYQSQLVNKNQTTRNYGGSYQTRNSPYTMSGVSDYTRSKLNGLEGGYTPSGSVQAAQAYLEQVKASKPGAYQSRWDDELTSLYDQIRNRKKFSYDMGTDPLYQQYREQYQRLGRLAMQDTMGQAAALTGGYGSTYGEQVGQQAYNAYLQNLNDIVPQLQQQAYQRYQDEGTDLYNQYSLVKGREDTDYGRYRDTVSDYYSDLSDARSAYNSERSLDQSQWATMLDYWAQKANNENAAYLQALAAEQAAAKKSGGGGGGGSSSAGLNLINGYGNRDENVSMLDASYRGVMQTISTLLAQGKTERAYDEAVNARSQMSKQQWNNLANLIWERTGQKIDSGVSYKQAKVSKSRK
jgi:hypothetical protein|nr:MAG TPA: hypothetical protein [Caudoviricetes sp.]DAZ14301.1 MAG TPA: hypothetical protein [Caudoviricetes sp.]